MKRTAFHHPVVSTVHQFIKQRDLLQPGQTVIAAVSGGIDSMVMLRLLLALRPLWNIEIVVAHVNFQLRGKASDGDEAFVRKAAGQFGLPFYSTRSATMAAARKKKRSVQETARMIRYEFFDRLKHTLGADVIVTAHHADDNTETMFFHFLRGAGVDGLSGIPVRREAIVRPLLCVTRKEIAEYAKEHAVSFRTDKTNAHDEYTRNFLRNKVIPVLQRRLNPSLNETLLNTSELFHTVGDYIETETERAYRIVVSSSVIDLRKFTALHRLLQQEVVRLMLKKLSLEPSYDSIRSVVDLSGRQKGTIIDIQNNWVAERLEKSILLRSGEQPKAFRLRLTKAGSVTAGEVIVTVKKSGLPDNKRGGDPSTEYVDADRLTFPLVIRSWKPGDRFRPLGMRGEKKVSDFFGDLKLSAAEKMNVPVVESDGMIVWVGGRRLDDRFKITDSTTAVYQLSVQYGKKNDHR